MTVAEQATEAGGVMPPATVKVWDPFVRVFHWSLVALFIAAFATGDENDKLHIALGYGLAVLLALRLVWGWRTAHSAARALCSVPERASTAAPLVSGRSHLGTLRICFNGSRSAFGRGSECSCDRTPCVRADAVAPRTAASAVAGSARW